jgi:hypothetical protein
MIHIQHIVIITVYLKCENVNSCIWTLTLILFIPHLASMLDLYVFMYNWAWMVSVWKQTFVWFNVLCLHYIMHHSVFSCTCICMHDHNWYIRYIQCLSQYISSMYSSDQSNLYFYVISKISNGRWINVMTLKWTNTFLIQYKFPSHTISLFQVF